MSRKDGSPEQDRRSSPGLRAFTEPTFELVDVNDLLDDVLLLTRQKLRQQKIELVRKFGEGLPKVRADRGQIEQACLNLILNAADAMCAAEP